MDGLLSIGAFSARCGLSAKVIRTYGAAGLLTPEAVDQHSGYRYYSPDQLAQAELIAVLRAAGIAVTEIAEFLRHPDSAVLDRWQHELAGESTARRTALARARAAVTADHGRPSARPNELTKGPEMDERIASGVRTDIGGRAINQDGALVADGLFAVADGFGHGGEIASHVALQALRTGFSADGTIAGLLAACQEANSAVWQRVHAQHESATMGTTLTVFAITDDMGFVVVHVGDSRLYQFRCGRLSQLTSDHTVGRGGQDNVTAVVLVM